MRGVFWEAEGWESDQGTMKRRRMKGRQKATTLKRGRRRRKERVLKEIMEREGGVFQRGAISAWATGGRTIISPSLELQSTPI